MSDTNYNDIETGEFEGRVTVGKTDDGPFLRFLRRFIKKDFRQIEGYITEDVIKPRLADTIYDVFTNALAMILFDDEYESRSKGTLTSSYSKSSNGYRDYAKHSKSASNNHSRVKSDPAVEEEDRINKYEVRTVYFESRKDAIDTLEYLRRYIDKYESVPLSVYYSYVKAPNEWPYSKYGWTDLRSARPIMIRGGKYWTLSLPPLEYLEEN